MTKDDYYKLINDFLNKYHKKQYSRKKLRKIFHISKKNKKIFIKSLKKLEKEGKIIRRGKNYSALQTYRTVEGRFDTSALANNYPFGFVISEETDIKVYRKNSLNACHNDIVKVDIIEEKNNRQIGKITKIISRANEKIIGSIEVIDEEVILIPDNPNIDFDIRIENYPKHYKNILNKKALVKVIDWGNRDKDIEPVAEIIEVLGNIDDPGLDSVCVIKQYDLPEEFPKEVIKQSKEINEEINLDEITRRKDLRDLTTFTIDPIDAKDFDDALSYEKIEEGHRIYIHIADVSYYVKIDSPIFQEAYDRGTSVYLLQDVVPMLPTQISNNICSLKPNKDRLTISVIIDLDNNYKILRRIIYPTIINSDARLNYKEVDRLFRYNQADIESDEIREKLFSLLPIIKYLTKKRYERGGLDFDLPEAEFEFDETGAPINILRRRQTQSHLLIEELMLLANQFVAELTAQKCDTGIFRVHEEPDPKKMGEFAILAKCYNYHLTFSRGNENFALKNFLDSISNASHHRVFDNLLLRSLMKAKYSYKNSGHFGLALKSYTHFTSPIRRFPDLVVHHLIKQDVFEWTAKKFSVSDIKNFAKRASEMEIIALNAERTLGRIKKNRFMRENIGKVYLAIITNFNNKNIFVELDDYPIEGYIPLSSIKNDYYTFNNKNYYMNGKRSNRKFFLCQKVKVKVKRVEHSVEFELVSD